MDRSLVVRRSWLPLAAGCALSTACAASSIALSSLQVLQDWGIGPLTLAILLGMLVGNTVYPRLSAGASPGVEFSKQRLLRLGIVLYGLRLTMQQVADMGVPGVLIDLIMVISTFRLALLAGTRWLKLDHETAALIGIGNAICGAAAVLAAEPVMRARAEQAGIAIATVVVFGTLALFLYPVLYQINAHLHLVQVGPVGFGRYVGSTVHEVAQAVAAGRAVSADAADSAVVAKMVRVMMLAPFLLLLSRSSGSTAHQPQAAAGARRIQVPWFAFGFIAMVLVHSSGLLPARAVTAGIAVDGWLLAIAMAALGLTTSARAVRRAGHRPLLLAATLFCWLTVGGALVNGTVQLLLGPAGH